MPRMVSWYAISQVRYLVPAYILEMEMMVKSFYCEYLKFLSDKNIPPPRFAVSLPLRMKKYNKKLYAKMLFIQLKSKILTLMSVLITFTIRPLEASAELQNENYSIYNTHRECSGLGGY